MFNKKIILACFAAASMLSANLSFAEDESEPQGDAVHVTLSAKVWNESWSTWDTVYGTPGAGGTLINAADTANAFIGGVTVKAGNLFVNGNFAPQTEFTFPEVGTTYKRKEYDVNVGYYLHPQIGLSLGSKTVEVEYNPNAVWKHKFVTLGLNSSARIGESRFFMYQNGAVSLTGRTDVSFTLNSTKGTTKYQSLEAGLGMSVMPGLTLTAGYKFQQVELPLTFTTGLTVNTRDTTTGFIFGAAYTF